MTAPPFDLDLASATLGALAHPARLTVMKMVLEREWDMNSMGDVVQLSQSALSQHLKKLKDAGLVTARRDKQPVFYSSHSEAARRIISCLER